MVDIFHYYLLKAYSPVNRRGSLTSGLLVDRYIYLDLLHPVNREGHIRRNKLYIATTGKILTQCYS